MAAIPLGWQYGEHLSAGRSAYEYWYSLRLDAGVHLGEGEPVARESRWLDMSPARIRALPNRCPSDALVRDLLAHELRGLDATWHARCRELRVQLLDHHERGGF